MMTVGEATEWAAVSAAAGVPLHRQLFLVLHDEISRGVLAPGDPLPTEHSLCEQFGVSRITVRRALADLADSGYIERRHGVGSFVREGLTPSAPQVDGSYIDELRQIQFETEVDVLEWDIAPAPAPVAARLGAGPDLLHIVRVRRERRTAEPLMLTDAWLPPDLATVVTRDILCTTALYAVLAGAGIAIDRMDHEVTAEVAGPRTGQLLDTPLGSAVLRVNRTAFTAAGPHHQLSIMLSPSRSRLLISQSDSAGSAVRGLAIAHDVRR
jgi:GntR family transcriptional regulator